MTYLQDIFGKLLLQRPILIIKVKVARPKTRSGSQQQNMKQREASEKPHVLTVIGILVL